jgi:hypothetical protein
MNLLTRLNEVLMGKPPKLHTEITANKIGFKLDRLAVTPKCVQTKILVAQMQPKIEAAQAAGHSLEEILNAFKSEGVDLTLNTFKQYLRASRSDVAMAAPAPPTSSEAPAQPTNKLPAPPTSSEAPAQRTNRPLAKIPITPSDFAEAKLRSSSPENKQH